MKYLIPLVFVAFACKKETMTPTPTTENTDNKTFSYLALGDSYTIGESVSVQERWPVILADTLNKTGTSIAGPKIIAKTGWRTDNLMSGIALENYTVTTFDLVSVLIGVNNQYQGYSVESYRPEFKKVMSKALELAGNDTSRVFVVSIPDYGVTPFGASNKEAIGTAIDAFNKVNKEVSDSLGVAYFDITPISREAETDSELIASDGLHPSGKMYQRWVDLFFKDVEALLKN